MRVGHSEIKNSNFSNVLKFTIVIFIVILFSALGGWQIYNLLHRTRIQSFLDSEKEMGLLFHSIRNSPQGEITSLVSTILIQPATKRIGIISFYPETHLKPESLEIGKRFLKEDEDIIRNEIADLLQIEIPYFMKFDSESIAAGIDLMEGLPAFLWDKDIEEKENLPTGEINVDGALASRMLNFEGVKNPSPSGVAFRIYSMGLNFWQVRKEKWEILKNSGIFELAVSTLKTNISPDDIFLLSEIFFTGEEWTPYFIEMPVRRVQEEFHLDTETASLYMKNFFHVLRQKENPMHDEPPKVEIKNGTNIGRLAKKMRYEIARMGFRILEFSNADRHDYENTILLDVNARADYANLMKKELKIKRVYHLINRTMLTDMVLILGKDYKDLRTTQNE